MVTLVSAQTSLDVARQEVLVVVHVANFQVQRNNLAQTEGVQDTCAQNSTITLGVLAECVVYTSTQIGDEVPNTSLVVTADHVAQVEQHLLVNSQIERSTLHRNLVKVDGLESLTLPTEVSLGTQTETGSEPLTNSNREAQACGVLAILPGLRTQTELAERRREQLVATLYFSVGSS